MESVGTLINKLKDQFEQHANVEHLLATIQQISAELQVIKSLEIQNENVLQQHEFEPGIGENNTNQYNIAQQEVLNAVNDNIWNSYSTVDSQPIVHHKFSVDSLLPVNDTTVSNQVLNDILKDDTVELATKLVEAPIEDLRKAITINDRYLFTSMLFMGDENNFDRSIRTINSFNMLAEAQYWIQRELKVKMGWQDENGTVKHFYSLVRRRFS